MTTHASVLLAGLSGSLLLGAAASADFTGMVTEAKDLGDTSGWLDPTLDLLAVNVFMQFDDPLDRGYVVGSLPSIPLLIQVENGLFFQHAMGGIVRPEVEDVALFPSLAFDSFITFNTKTSADGHAPSMHHALPPFEGGPFAATNAGWFVTPSDPLSMPDASGRVLVGQFTVDLAMTPSATAITGEFMIQWNDADGNPTQVASGFAHAIPAPGALPLLAAAALLGRRRRRRRRPDPPPS